MCILRSVQSTKRSKRKLCSSPKFRPTSLLLAPILQAPTTIPHPGERTNKAGWAPSKCARLAISGGYGKWLRIFGQHYLGNFGFSGISAYSALSALAEHAPAALFRKAHELLCIESPCTRSRGFTLLVESTIRQLLNLFSCLFFLIDIELRADSIIGSSGVFFCFGISFILWPS